MAAAVNVRTEGPSAAHRAAASSLVVVPAQGTDGQAPVGPDTMLLGLPLLRRSVLAARRAGFGRILVLTSQPAEVTRWLDGAPATVLPLGAPLPPVPPGRIVVLAGNILPHPRWLRTLLEMPVAPGQMVREADVVGVIEAADAGAIVSGLSGGPRAADLFASLGRSFETVDRPLGLQGMCALRTPGDIPGAEDWLLRGLVKETEGFMSRHVERRISLRITRWLVRTRIQPNAMTAVSVGIGLLGAPFFLSSRPSAQLAGALLFLAHSILDGCDGELARLRFQESRWGGLCDFWGDNLVHVAVFLCMAVGWSLAAQAAWPLLIGGVALAGVLCSAGFVDRQILRAKDADGPLFASLLPSKASGVPALLDALARRDFIYGVVLLSALGKAKWFLVLAAAGAPIFFLLLLWIVCTDPLYRETWS